MVRSSRAGRKSLHGYNEHLLILGPHRRWQAPESNSGRRARANEYLLYLRELLLGGFFIFFIFYFRFRNLQEYTPAAPLPGGRDLVSPLRGGRGFCAKTFAKIFARRSLRAGRPAAGRPARAAQLLGDRFSHPYIRVGWSPHLSFASLKFQKPRKKSEGGREAKPCRIFEPATVANQNSSTLYK